ncbi:HDOD domain protein [Posidoniimonas corsicana]|uniref:HDOD domain protein n=1 Tax=Posidoniimonas corsicana TaxID=1938618 RepID=A0A5C5VG63_9BACT|nr:HDOD domain-containing protein [Posidoniimonas corsicana]TWT37053.1 HDOD domain protein [Posidoniimonas corsicana]
MPQTANPAIDKLVTQAGNLYSLPSVAVEVLQLTEQQDVDVKQLRDAIGRDPALSAKLLRVVNSSLFGLSGEVADLNQALALLGVEPLKVLVLGFSLPDGLFARMAGEPLKRYWTTSLTRAVCAKSLAPRFGGVSPDVAFLAGLLRDIGMLVMVQQLGEPYLRFLTLAADAPEELTELERQSLGFDHTQLTASLLREWKLPEALCGAVDFAAGDPLATGDPGLRPVVMLAERLSRLVLDRRLDALPDLLELGHAACGLTKQQLNDMLEPLQQQVDQLAAAMAVELSDEINLEQLIADAHRLLSTASEQYVCDELTARSDDEVAEALLAETHEVRLAMRSFLRGRAAAGELLQRAEGAHPARAHSAPKQPADMSATARARLRDTLDKVAARCRIERRELSVALLHTARPPRTESADAERELRQALAAAQDRTQPEHATRLTLDEVRVAILMPGVDRRDAVAYCNAAVEAAALGEHVRLRAGVASVTLVPNRFEVDRLIDGAAGCLNGAQVAGSTSVKSIEVY